MTTPSRKPAIKLIDGKATTTSLEIAKHFGKQHYRVLRAIKAIECSQEFSAANFGVADYLDEQGKPRKAYTITKDGFMFLAMGFTGKEAAQWKEKFIEAFNALELRVNQRTTSGKPVAKALPNPENKRYNYPRHLLEQEYFTSPTRSAKLSISMLGNEKEFSSTLLNLLLELKMDGHNVHAPYDEYMAMREAIIKANRAMDEILHIVLKATAQPASTAKD